MNSLSSSFLVCSKSLRASPSTFDTHYFCFIVVSVLTAKAVLMFASVLSFVHPPPNELPCQPSEGTRTESAGEKRRWRRIKERERDTTTKLTNIHPRLPNEIIKMFSMKVSSDGRQHSNVFFFRSFVSSFLIIILYNQFSLSSLQTSLSFLVATPRDSLNVL